MTITLENTTVAHVSRRLLELGLAGGNRSLSRVLTLILAATPGSVEEAIAAAREAAREHPMRVLAVLSDPDGPDRLDAEIRAAGAAGASEVLVLRASGGPSRSPESLVSGLLLPDVPVVTWWAGCWPAGAAAGLGSLGQRRITDAGSFAAPATRLLANAGTALPGDTDLSWARITLWRAQLAAALENDPGGRTTGVTVSGTPDSASTLLLAAWLRLRLGVPVARVDLPPGSSLAWGIHSVVLHRDGGPIALTRSTGTLARLVQPGHPPLEVPLPRRPLPECLAEDLRVLGPDPEFTATLRDGLPLLLADAEVEP